MRDEKTKIGYFERPTTFFVTHVLSPLISLATVGWGYWAMNEVETGTLAVRVKILLGASLALPCLSLAVLLFRRRRITTSILLTFLILGVAYLFFGLRVALDVAGGPVVSYPITSLFLGVFPMIFVGIAQLATRDLRIKGWESGLISLSLIVFPPVVVYIFSHVLLGSRSVFSVKSTDEYLFFSVFSVCTILFFIGLVRILAFIFRIIADSSGYSAKRRITLTAIIALLLPLGGLALNLSLPFPADFANGWAWGLAIFTGLALLLPVSATRWGLFVYALRFVAAPFVGYFFLVFLPFLPLAIPAVLLFGLGFLMLSPMFLAALWVKSVRSAYRTLRTRFPRWRISLVAFAAMLVIPSAFIIQIELERPDVQALVAWQADEDFGEPPKPLPLSVERAKQMMNEINASTFGAEIPYISAWRTFRTLGGVRLSDYARNRLNCHIFGHSVEDLRDLRREKGRRGSFWGDLSGSRSLRRTSSRRNRGRGYVPPPRTLNYIASARAASTNEVEGLYVVTIRTSATSRDHELFLDFRLPAGAWIEGLRLKMPDGAWKTARLAERKAAEWVYNRVTQFRHDPAIVTLDTPTEGYLRIFPVDRLGREAELTIRLPDQSAAKELITFSAEKSVWKAVPNPDWKADFEVSRRIYTAKNARVSVIPAAYFAAHTNDIIALKQDEAPLTVNLSAPDPYGRMRRLLRTHAKIGSVPQLELIEKSLGSSNRYEVVTNALTSQCGLEKADWITFRRELPGVAAFGDRPIDGFLPVETTEGRTLYAPYRRGENAILFERLKGAMEVGGAWNDGAKTWELENRAFLNPALDVRRELLAQSRGSHVLTTKSAYVVLETAAQEKMLRKKEKEALSADPSLDFVLSGTVGDTPGFGWMVLLLLLLSIMGKLWRKFFPKSTAA